MSKFIHSRLPLFIAIFISISAGMTWAAKPPVVGDEAKDFELKDISGKSIKLSKLTSAGPAVLVLLRGYPGYQCPYCTRQFADFLAKADDFKKGGAQVVFVYPGPSDALKQHAEEFLGSKTFPAHFHFLLDPDYEFTNAYGLRWDAKKETAYPSTFVIDSKSKVTFAKVSKSHSDRVKAADALTAVAKIQQ